MIVKRIQPLSLAKVMAVVYGGLGLIVGALFSFFAIVGSAFAQALEQGAPPAFFGLIFGAGAIVVLPLFYGLLGFVGGFIVSGLYNLSVRFTGGLELEVE